MIKDPNILLQFACAAAPAACTGQQPVDRQAQPDAAEIAKILGCTDEEVAVCIDVNCEPREYQCVDKADVKAMLGVRDFPRH